MKEKRQGASQLGSEAPRQSGPMGGKLTGRKDFQSIGELAGSLLRDVIRRRDGR